MAGILQRAMGRVGRSGSVRIAVATAFLLSAIAGQAQTRVRTLRVGSSESSWRLGGGGTVLG